MKMEKILSLEECTDLIRLVSNSYVITHEALRLSCCEDEASTELLGINNYSEINLSEGDFVSAITCEMYDGTFVHILFNFDEVYSLVLQADDGEILQVKKM